MKSTPEKALAYTTYCVYYFINKGTNKQISFAVCLVINCNRIRDG